MRFYLALINLDKMALTINNIEAELSYAYLHAVAGKAGMSCKPGDRQDDGHGVDAEINYRNVTSHPFHKHIQLNIQLKATSGSSGMDKGHARYFIDDTKRYDKLRSQDSDIYKILIVLFLPKDPKDWLDCDEDELIMKHAAYWICLYGAEQSGNDSGQTIYIPRSHLLTPEELIRIANLAAVKKIPNYVSSAK